MQLIKNKQISEMHETGAKKRKRKRRRGRERKREKERAWHRVNRKTVNEQCGPCGTGH